MTLVPSLLQAIVLMDGEALVLHVGDKPYVVAESGQVTLANTPLTATSIGEVIHELLPPESRRVLEEVGATQCLLPENPLFPGERFSVVAARGGNDLWLEIRRSLEPHDGYVIRRTAATTLPEPASRSDERRASAQAPGRIIEPALADSESHPAVVLPLTRNPVKADVPPPLADHAMSGVDRLLRLAAARGASTVYLVSGARPSIRLDGEVQVLDGAPCSARTTSSRCC